MPEVKPLKSESGPTVRQPKAPFRALPANSLHIGPSGSGKSLALLRTLMDSDKLGGLFDRYELYSPNIFIDPQYKVLIRKIEETTNQKQDDFCHEEFDQEAVLGHDFTEDSWFVHCLSCLFCFRFSFYCFPSISWFRGLHGAPQGPHGDILTNFHRILS